MGRAFSGVDATSSAPDISLGVGALLIHVHRADMNDAKRFLFAMWDGGGNGPPVFGIVRQLVARGHYVRVLGDPTLAAEAQKAGAEHTPWVLAPHRKSRRPEDDLIKDD